MSDQLNCPKCNSIDVKITDRCLCRDCGCEFVRDKTYKPLKIFLSYGHDENEGLVRKIKKHLADGRGHTVWIDKNPEDKEAGIRPGNDWRRDITEGLKNSNSVLSFLSRHSVREPGVCLDEIGIALGYWDCSVKTILVEPEDTVEIPTTVSHIQWVDMRDWRERINDKEWFEEKLAEIVESIESPENRRLAGEIEQLQKLLEIKIANTRVQQLIGKKFVGREWLNSKVREWCETGIQKNRVCWIQGGPGVGKSAFSANLAHYTKSEVIAFHFCEWDKPRMNSPMQIVRNLAFLLATRLPDYRLKLLDRLRTTPIVGDEGASELFDQLLVSLLQKGIDGSRGPYVILIDAIDEVSKNGRNEMANVLAVNANRLPSWVGILVTSRPETEIVTSLNNLKGINPLIIDALSADNKKDISQYCFDRLCPSLDGYKDIDGVVEEIIAKSEGAFLYAEHICTHICEEVKEKGGFELDHLDGLPNGLDGIYKLYFERCFSSIHEYKNKFRDALAVLVVTYEQISVTQLQELLGWTDNQINDSINDMASLIYEVDGKLQPFHKSIYEWLTDRSRAGHYVVSAKEGHNIILNEGLLQYRNGVSGMDEYYLRYLPQHLVNTKRWDELYELMTDLFYLEVRVQQDSVFTLVSDYALAVSEIPAGFPGRHLLALLDEAIRRDIYFIHRHRYDYPQAFFQCMWNSCWWYEYLCRNGRCQDKRKPTTSVDLQPSSLLETWRKQREQRYGKFNWLRSHRPPSIPMGLGVKFILRDYQGEGLGTMTFSPNEAYLACGAGDKVVIWEVMSGRKYAVLYGKAPVYCLAYNSDGKCLAGGGENGLIVIWDVDTQEPVTVLQEGCKLVEWVAFSPDGKNIITKCHNEVNIWALVDRREKNVFRTQRFIERVSISDDSCQIMVSTPGELHVIDLVSGEEVRTVVNHDTPSACFASSPNCQHMLTYSNWIFDLCKSNEIKSIKNWDSTKNEESRLIWWGSGKSEYPRILYSHNSRFFVIGLTNEIRVYTTETNTQLASLSIGGESGNGIGSIACSTDARWIAGNVDGSILVWGYDEENTGSVQGQSVRPKECYSGRSLNPENVSSNGFELMSCSSDGRWMVRYDKLLFESPYDLHVHDLAKGEGKTLSGHTESINSVAFSPDSRLIVSGAGGVVPGGENGSMRIWDVEDGEIVEVAEGFPCDVSCVAYSPNGRNIAFALANVIIVVDLMGGAERTYEGPDNSSVSCIAYSSDGRLIVGVWQFSYSQPLEKKGEEEIRASIRVLNAETVQELRRLDSPFQLLRGSVAFTKDGKGIITVPTTLDGGCIMWDAETGRVIKIYTASDRWTTAAIEALQSPWHVTCQNQETVIELKTLKKKHVVGIYPVELRRKTPIPNSRVWAGYQTNDLHIFSVETSDLFIVMMQALGTDMSLEKISKEPCPLCDGTKRVLAEAYMQRGISENQHDAAIGLYEKSYLLYRELYEHACASMEDDAEEIESRMAVSVVMIGYLLAGSYSKVGRKIDAKITANAALEVIGSLQMTKEAFNIIVYLQYVRRPYLPYISIALPPLLAMAGIALGYMSSKLWVVGIPLISLAIIIMMIGIVVLVAGKIRSRKRMNEVANDCGST